MAGIKRKSPAANAHSGNKDTSKKAKFEKSALKNTPKPELAVHDGKFVKKAKVKGESGDSIEASTSKDGDAFSVQEGADLTQPGKASTLASLDGCDLATSSREAHAKQKALAKERKAAKPNADIIDRSKKLWEKLRLKSHVEKEERKKLVGELFEIVTGRVKDFVFKHDSVRVIQCAIKYSNMEQRRMIARELKGEFKTLAEGKYSKFLIAKLLEKGDPEIRDIIISEFYGHVRRLINHPEAAWMLDDTYRAVATPEQKSRLLCEWYGPEFSIRGLKPEGTKTTELSAILTESPEKRKPIMDHLETQINQIIQKKLTGFTMLHDAMLQYFLACKAGSTESSDFLGHLKPDATLREGEEADNADLLKNLAFTKSGSRLVSLAFAYGTAKDRKLLLRPYKDTIEMMATDVNAHHVLLAALAVIDDTKLTSKSIFGELLPSNDSLPDKVLNLAGDVRARTILLYPFAAGSKWLLEAHTLERLSELYAIRSATSKKDPDTRLHELARAVEPHLLTAIAARASDFASFSFGLQFMGEVLVGAPEVELDKRKEALTEVAGLAQQILDFTPVAPGPETHDATGKCDLTTHGKNMLKTLVQGGKFDPKTKKVVPVEPPLGFADMFWDQVKDNLIQWATGPGSFVVVGLVEAGGFLRKTEVLNTLNAGRNKLEAAAGPPINDMEKKRGKNSAKPPGKGKGNAGTRILLEKLYSR
ncbi:pumilio domain-containing protein [Lindgomyces ingoldianus]|uniref:Pumilio domain-containing protein n=1 Tax=Lindgomyces ingoldianus TaxID=673940 RepID=A0ACB6QY20_9PLEO|nr:pumilio domain-containing protein [Lindgomyces ingoldianus]KAF2471949.1 pumilio domain-containing protein [Lindgomyces ingoldianus]